MAYLFLRCCVVILIFAGSMVHASVDKHFQNLVNKPQALYAFLKAMPKGGELHYHFDGSLYAETLLHTNQNVCLDPKTMTGQACTSKNSLRVKDILQQPKLLRKTIRAWSLQDFVPSQSESAYQHFHRIFPKIFLSQSQNQGALLATLLRRASEQHEHYLEIIAFGLANDDHYADAIRAARDNHQKRQILLADPSFQKNIQTIVNQSEKIIDDARLALNCAHKPQEPGCEIPVNFQCYVRRVKSIDAVFAQTLAGFVAATRSKRIVAVNLVDLEDNPIAQQDYIKQMHIFGYLHTLYPNVHIALHAGELFPQRLVPHQVRSPIREAIIVGQAERIGHGLDIQAEPHPADLAALMAKRAIPVEINLTSNRLLFGLTSQHHPLLYYLLHHVPVVLSTDDEGMLRTELSKEYIEAVKNYHLDYPTLKQINRNTLTYGFIPGQSLWQDPQKAQRVPACQSLRSQACKLFIHANPKAQLQWELEQALLQFESQF